MPDRFVFGFLLAGALSSQLLAAPSGEKRRYLVATHPGAVMKLSDVAILRSFRSVSGFAAELTETQVEQLRKSAAVRFVEPDQKRYLLGSGQFLAASSVAGQRIPYGIDLVRAREVWPLATGRGIKVGVIDTGVDRSHADLRERFRGGRDFVNHDDDPTDDNGHGTHVAGIIAASNNSVGVVGIAPDAEIYALKVLNAEGGGSRATFVSDLIDAVIWAIENRLNILNLSLGCSAAEGECEPSALEEEAFQLAADAGILTIAASGNDFDVIQREFVSYPAAYSSVLAVGAVNSRSQIGSFSNRGSELDVVAPGVFVFSTVRTGTGASADVRSGADSYDAIAMIGSPKKESAGPTVFAGLGRVSDFTPAVSGKIALIQRGELTFNEKARNAKAAGAIGVIVFNNVPGVLDFYPTLIRRDASGKDLPEDVNFDWPLTVMITMEAGAILRNGGSEVTVVSEQADYDFKSGTSMACPHVAGIAALIWSLAPNATATQVRQAILDSAVDLGAGGFDTTFGFGLGNAYSAARRLAPERFPALPRRRPTRP